MAIKIAMANQKGGVGKTATVVSLGAALAAAGKRVLMIDSDAQGSMSMSVGVREPDEENYNLSALYRLEYKGEEYNIQDYIHHHEKEHYDFIVGNTLLSETDVELTSMMDREYILQDILRQVDALYDYILIDCMPSLGFLTINALTAADYVIIPTHSQFLSFKGMELLFRTISRVKNRKNKELKVAGILVTMMTLNSKTEQAFVQLLHEQYQDYPIFNVIIPRTVKMHETTVTGASIFSYDHKSKVAAAYEELAKEVMEKYGA